MDSFFEGLYEKFILRDILGKVVPGFLFLVTINRFVYPGIIPNVLGDEGIVSLFVFFAISYVSGMFIQWVAVNVGFLRIYVWPGGKNKTSQTQSLEKYLTFLKKATPEIRNQRERLVVLKHVSGNFATVFFLLR